MRLPLAALAPPALLLSLTLSLAWGCATTEPAAAVRTTANAPTEDPCRGAALDLHQVEARCSVKRRPSPDQPAGLKVSIVPARVEIRTGAQAEVAVRFTNVTSKLLRLDLSRGCGGFDSSILDSDGEAADQEGLAPLMGGLCGTPPPVAVALEPGGYIQVKVPVSARKQRWVTQGHQAVAEPGGPIPPGTYTLVISSPYSDPVDGDPRHRRGRSVKAQLVVTP